MSRSDYIYDVDYENQILVIKDLNLGRMSVTNNAENVLTEIEHEINLYGESIIGKKYIIKIVEVMLMKLYHFGVMVNVPVYHLL